MNQTVPPTPQPPRVPKAAFSATLQALPTSALQFLDDAGFCIRGAEMHLDAVRMIIARTRSVALDELTWRTRSVFWELIGAWDLFLMWATERHDLRMKGRRLRHHEVAINNVFLSTSSDQAWPGIRQILYETVESPWFFELREYRNFAHKWVIGSEELIVQKTATTHYMLPLARVGQDRLDFYTQLDLYVEQMIALGAKLDPRRQNA
ncbi:hypothetical protein [Burkholderia cenocepacia]|uniref:hypothetical protein n=1 Tax=Burkholderia cenocepacia TaxID=95486 RepID=UPI00264F24A0|nr:hypothetical protein [Burkholderia cenocepacia]MDN7683442.1 hypothetical protein [Burkholderia cenocepacia]